MRPETPILLRLRISRVSISSCAAEAPVVCLGGASTFAIAQFKLPVRNVVAGLKPEEFFLRGSLVEVTTDPSHQVMAGMPEKAAVFVDGSPIFETLEGFNGRVLAIPGDRLSASIGLLDRREAFARQGCRARRTAGSGARPAARIPAAWRGQPFGTLRVLFNSALYTVHRPVTDRSG